MKVWILQTGEPLHIDSAGLRPMRAMNLSNALIEKGHQVVLWSSDFDHFSKKHRTGKTSTIQVSENLELRLISSRGYKSHVGLSRLFDHAQLAFNLRKELKNQTPPDVAFIGYPPIETAWVVTNWLTKKKISTMVDVKDAWPDVLLRAFPKNFRGLAKIALTPYFLMMKSTLSKASAISSISEPFLIWSLKVATRPLNQFDNVSILTSPVEVFSEEELNKSRTFWDSKFVTNKSKVRCFYVGSLTEALNFDGIIYAARNSDVEFVIAGTGPTEKTLREAIFDLPNVKMPGWISSAQAKILAERSTFMLAPYANLDDFSIALPNKFLDAMKFSKPILTSIPGFAANFVTTKEIGIVYSNERISSLLEIFRDLSSHPEKIFKMAKNSGSTFENLFTYDKVYGQLVEKLVQMIHRK
jgi:glycosyltransferase involved in cell wall biosynthesis